MHSSRADQSRDAPANEWLIWQLADSAFPAGSFAHSGGLEAAWQHGRVETVEALRDFVDAALVQAARGSAPLAAEACRAPHRFAKLAKLCDAMLANHVANRASRAQGHSMLAAAERIFPSFGIAGVREEVRSRRLPPHLAPIFGRLAVRLGVSVERASRLLLFFTLRGTISSAVRLGIVGPMEGQAIQANFSARAEQLAVAALGVRADDAAQTAPILDLLQGSHDRLYSRLFQS